LNNLGLALRASERSEEATSAFRSAAAIFRETGDQYGRGVTLNNLGNVLAEVGRFEEAITAHQDAAAIFRETSDRYREGIELEIVERDRKEQRPGRTSFPLAYPPSGRFRRPGDVAESIWAFLPSFWPRNSFVEID
jgi:tetratricopeptide (TPR) repeat protein